MWTNFKAIHQSCGDQTENQLMCKLTDKKAQDGNDIIQHFASIKQTWDHITLVCQGDLSHSPKLFKKFLAYSLSPTLDKFTCQFSCDSAKKNLSVPQFISECYKEYRRCVQRSNKSNDSTYSAYGKPLSNRIGREAQDQK
jgi:gag-polypeptide of LTR copia-type